MKIYDSETQRQIRKNLHLISQFSKRKNSTFLSLEERKKRKKFQEIFSNSILNLKERNFLTNYHFPIQSKNNSICKSKEYTINLPFYPEKLENDLGMISAQYQTKDEKKKKFKSLKKKLSSSFNVSPQLSECRDIFLKNPTNLSKYLLN
jgi:hypothetical protein